MRMICTECGQEIDGFVCRECRVRRTRRGLLLHQRRFIETWLAGAIDLRVKRLRGVLHLELFDDPWHSYCDTELFAVTQRAYVKALPADVCPECQKVFDALIAEAKEV